MTHSLFETEQIRLRAFQDKDAEVESRWTHDADYIRALGNTLPRPLAPFHIKKNYEKLGKASNELKTSFTYAIRLRADDRLIGFARLAWIEWTNGAAHLALGIGLPEERGHGYGSEALQMLLHYAFNELNLHRLQTVVSSDNVRGLKFLERAGFQVEVRRREAVERAGKRYDDLNLGLLRAGWLAHGGK